MFDSKRGGLRKSLEELIRATQANFDHTIGETRNIARLFNKLAADVDYLYEALGIPRDTPDLSDADPGSSVNVEVGEHDHPEADDNRRGKRRKPPGIWPLDEGAEYGMWVPPTKGGIRSVSLTDAYPTGLLGVGIVGSELQLTVNENPAFGAPHTSDLTFDTAATAPNVYEVFTVDTGITANRAVKFSTSNPPRVIDCSATTDAAIGIASATQGDGTSSTIITRGRQGATIDSGTATTKGVTLLAPTSAGRLQAVANGQTPFAIALETGASGSNRDEFVYVLGWSATHTHASAAGTAGRDGAPGFPGADADDGFFLPPRVPNLSTRTEYIFVTPDMVQYDDATLGSTGATPDLVSQTVHAEASGRTGFYFTYGVPGDWKSGTAISCSIVWYSNTSTGNMVWTISESELVNGDAPAETSSLAATDTTTADSTTVKETTLDTTFTPTTVGSAVKVNIERKAAAAGDTATGAGRILLIKLAYTAQGITGPPGATGATGASGTAAGALSHMKWGND